MSEHKLDWAKRWLEKPIRHYWGGEFTSGNSSQKFQSSNPATEENLTEIPEGSAVDVDAAVAAAESGFKNPAWRNISRRERARVLRQMGELVRKHQAELATLEALSNGKTYKEAFYDDMPDSADVFDYYAGWTDKFYGESCPVDGSFVNFTQRDPIGVCGLIVPWNFPLLLANWKIAPALAMGNTVVVKPAPFTSLSLIRFAELIHEAKILPPGVFNVVLGGATAGEAISRHSRIGKVSFTGSTVVGRRIVEGSAGSNLKGVTLELGGKSPNIIFDDIADLEGTVQRSFGSMFSHKGEKCSEPTRFFLHEKIYNRFLESLIPKVDAVICGEQFDPKSQQGAQCHKAQFEKILSYIEIGKSEGAKLLAGGERTGKKGYFVRPTVFGEVSQKMRIAQEEIFGPVVSCIPFRTEEEVVAMANDTGYGLAAGVFTADVSRAHRVAQALEAGMVFVNHYGCYDFASPFGGMKESGWGREMAIHSLESYTRLKSIWIKY